MSGSDTSKLKALMKKNLNILRRNVFSTIAEIVFPILLMLIILIWQCMNCYSNAIYYFPSKKNPISTKINTFGPSLKESKPLQVKCSHIKKLIHLNVI